VSDDATDPTVAATESSPVSARKPRSLERGASIGRLVVLDELGHGGMGVVYRAYDPQLDRRVAVKLLRPDAAQDHQERLLREGQAMAQLSHPNIVAVHDVGSLGEQIYISMELVEGESLRQWLKTPRTWREVLAVFAQAGRGLQAAHERKLIHRDFKPDNVLLGSDGRTRVADFGLARAVDVTDPDEPMEMAETGVGRALVTPLTRTGAMLGTPAYMAPEQLVGAATDERTDQFCYCVAFYEALYGERPFEAKTLAEQTLAVSQGRVRPAPKGSDVPSWLRQVIVRGLSARPEDRFPSMEALLGALPADPDSDASLSDRARALITALFGLTVFVIIGYLRYVLRAGDDLQRFDWRAFFAMAAFMAVIFGVPLYIWRKHVLATRISRQIVGSLLIIYYVSLGTSYVGARLQMTAAAIDIFNELWAGCCLILLGLTLRRLFLWMGLVAFCAAVLQLIFQSQAMNISQATLLVLLAVPAVAWGFRRKK
jgi:hypothetical protein